MPSTILIADDDRGIRTVIQQTLGRAGLNVRTTSMATTLWQWIDEGEGDLVITDVVMPDENGLDLLPRIRKRRPDMPIIVMSAHSTLLTAVKATERGAYEYLPKPFDINELVDIVKKALSQKLQLNTGAMDGVRPQPGEDSLPLIGRSQAMQEVYRTIARLTQTELTVLITGESGTGKELVARALHEFGARKAYRFVAVNMAAIPRDLIESELFGHEKGAFTGADARVRGRFEEAEGGTLFLDEIGDMPLEAQTRLLRVLQQGEFRPVGGGVQKRTDVRIIAATNRDLRHLVQQGLFREDLYYRLNVVPLRLPALRERTDDIPDLVRHFLNRAEEEGLPRKSIANTALSALEKHRWPGNVRELENLVRRFAALYTDEVITAEIVTAELSESARLDMPEPAAASDNLGEAVEHHLSTYFAAHENDTLPPDLYHRILREIERPLITLSLIKTRGNQIKAAELLGLNRNTLRKKIRELGIQVLRGGK